MIERRQHTAAIQKRLEAFGVVAIVGARQVGKTTLSRQIGDAWDGAVHSFDLEKPSDLARLREPELALSGLKGLVVLDEIQRLPELFPLLRVLVDRPDHQARFLVLGSASPELLRQSSESLAGRISYYELPGFSLSELGAEHADRLWLRGAFPRSFLADDESMSDRWRQDFITTFLERDLPALGINLQRSILRRFWTMLAHGHAQLWNGARLGASLGVAHTTARSYLDILEATFMVRLLPPYFVNVRKRQVKSPKVYLRDTGVLHSLLGIADRRALDAHPVLGASWEGFALEQVVHSLGVDRRHCYFWAVHSGAELDLVVEDRGKILGFEFKRTLAPKLTRSMKSAIDALEVSELNIVYPGSESYELADKVRVRPIEAFIN